VVQGDRGYLAQVHDDASSGQELWFSSDGRGWVPLRVESFRSGAAAGDEGFVAVGSGQVFASADGREWIEAAAPSGMQSVAAVGPDWFGVSVVLPVEGPEPGTATLWFSANGLDWSEAGQLQLGTSGECREWGSSLSGAGEWLFMHTELTYPCAEGAIQTAGNQYISPDGARWEALPFPHDSSHRIIDVDGTLIVAGRTAGRATFWIGEPTN
jgi:hypothetical protein